jgi:hypothetical protein
MAKHQLYQDFIQRLEASLADGHYFESAWYSYAVLEDRLRSLLRNSGGETLIGTHKLIRMMGPKLRELKARLKKDKLLAATFTDELHDRLHQWKSTRNDLMHAMADASMPLSEIDASAKTLATDGEVLVRDFCAACRRLKKHRAKVAP